MGDLQIVELTNIMQETMSQLKTRARSWPEPWGSHARELIRDAHFDLAFCQHKHMVSVMEDLRRALLATELEMQDTSLT